MSLLIYNRKHFMVGLFGHPVQFMVRMTTNPQVAKAKRYHLLPTWVSRPATGLRVVRMWRFSLWGEK